MPTKPGKKPLTQRLGITRRGDPLLYGREWRKENRERNNAYHREYWAKNKDKYKDKKNEYGKWFRRRRKYGLSKEDYGNILTAQGGCCKICTEKFDHDLRVDHDHATGEVRGLLCQQCNAGLGNFKDDIRNLQRAIGYLDQKGEINQ